jgi:hypothetical protein
MLSNLVRLHPLTLFRNSISTARILLPFSFVVVQVPNKGRAIAQAVSRWLPTAATRVRSRVWWSGICGGRGGAGICFLRVLRFPLPILIPPNSPSSQSPGSGTIDQKWPTCRVDLVWTSPPTVRIIKNCRLYIKMRKLSLLHKCNCFFPYFFIFMVHHILEIDVLCCLYNSLFPNSHRWNMWSVKLVL